MFTAGVASINIDIHMYGTVKLPVDDGGCILCANEIDSEFHVVLQFPLYEDISDT